MTPEYAFLLACCQPDPNLTLLRRQAATGLNWPTFVSLCFRHGVFPQVTRTLRRVDEIETLMPAPIWQKLSFNERRNALHSQIATEELLRLLTCFGEQGITAVPYKGPVLAQQAFGGVAGRRYGDLDILVRRAHIALAEDILLNEGYAASVARSEAQNEHHLAQHYHISYRQQVKGINVEVELHWGVAEKTLAFADPVTPAWGRRQTLRVLGQDVSVFSPADTLVMLTLHGAKHYWARVQWVSDVAALASQPDFDWAACLSLAKAMGLRQILAVGVVLAELLLGLSVPDTVRADLRLSPAGRAALSRVRAEILQLGPPKRQAMERSLFLLRLFDRRRDQLWYLLHWLITPTDEDLYLLTLPRRARFLYSVIRPARLLIQYRRRWWPL